MLSLDGVSETKSTTVSLDVYSIKFDGCRDVYPIKIVRPITKEEIVNKIQFSDVLEAVLAANLLLKNMIGDNPKRAFPKDAFQHSGKFSCEYCFESGVPFKNTCKDENSDFLESIHEQKRKILHAISVLNDNEDENSFQIKALQAIVKNLENAEKIGKKQRQSTHIVWPASTFNGERRTKEKVLDIVERIESGENLAPCERKGIKGRSILLNIEYYDFVLSTPAEYMHLVPFGVVKRLLELTFSVGESRFRNTKRPLTNPDLFNELMKLIKMAKEFSRRARKLDHSVMKAQELRNVLIFFFPLITQCLNGAEKEIKLWEMLAFMVRACILPEDEFTLVNVNEIKYCQKTVYILYQNLFGKKTALIQSMYLYVICLKLGHKDP